MEEKYKKKIDPKLDRKLQIYLEEFSAHRVNSEKYKYEELQPNEFMISEALDESGDVIEISEVDTDNFGTKVEETFNTSEKTIEPKSNIEVLQFLKKKLNKINLDFITRHSVE